jgi:hypothetical protein
MFCRICGYELPDNAQFCSRCGTPVTAPEEYTAAPVNTPVAPTKTSGKAITGFVMSLVGIFFGINIGYDFVGLIATIACGVIGLVFSILGKSEIKQKSLKGKGLATAGLIISIIVLSISALDVLDYMTGILFWGVEL